MFKISRYIQSNWNLVISSFLQGIEEEDVSPGFVLCDAANPIKVGRKFDAQVVILEHKSIICAGYSAVMHIHCAAEEITVNVRKYEFISLKGETIKLKLNFSLFHRLYCA